MKKRLGKIARSLLMLGSVLVGGALLTMNLANASVSNLSDRDFFNNGLDYSITGLKPVQDAVKRGDYTLAKSKLLQYFQQKQDYNFGVLEPVNDYYGAEAIMDYRFTVGAGERSVGRTTLTNQWKYQISNDLKPAINDEDLIEGQLSFILYNNVKQNGEGRIESREGAHPPILKVIKSDGSVVRLNPAKDTYINKIEHDSVFGSSPLLRVRDNIGDNRSVNISKVYMSFDLTSLEFDNIQEIYLEVYGFSTEASKRDLAIYRTREGSWAENSFKYKGHGSKTYGFSNIAGNVNWLGLPQPNDADGEYRWQIPRFYFINDLGGMYLYSKDERYAKQAIDLMLNAIKDTDAKRGLLPPYYNNGIASYPRSLDVAARIEMFTKAIQYFSNSQSMTPEACTDILKSIYKMGQFLNGSYGGDYYHPNNNWGVFESSSLIRSALRLKEFKTKSTWLGTGKSRVTSLLNKLVTEEGAYRESTSAYTFGVAGTYLGILQDVRNAGDDFDDQFVYKIKRLGKYVMNLNYPNGEDLLWGDSGAGQHKELIKDYGETLQDQEMIYVGSEGEEGKEPASKSAVYVDGGGIAMLRSGWGEEDLYLFMQAYKETSHKQRDDLSISMYAYGSPLLVDGGAFSYTSDTVSNWLKSTEAHNTVKVDNKEINAYGGDVLDEVASNGVQYVEMRNNGDVGYQHRRGVLVINNEYFMVSDYVDAGSGQHTAKALWHTAPHLNPVKGNDNKSIIANSNDASLPSLKIYSSSPVSLDVQDGYYSQDFYKAQNVRYGSFAKRQTGPITFDTLLLPQNSENQQDVVVTELPIQSINHKRATATKIQFPGKTDYVMIDHFSNEQESKLFDNLNVTGRTSYIRLDQQGMVQKLWLNRGQYVAKDNQPIISAGQSIGQLEVEYKGDTLIIQSPNLIPSQAGSVILHDQNRDINKVILNGEEIAYTTKSGYIYGVGFPEYTLNKWDIEDTFVQDGNKDNTSFYQAEKNIIKNDGAQGYNRKTYMKLDLSQLNEEQREKGTLRFYASRTKVDVTLAISKVAAFDPKSLTWRTQPARLSDISQVLINTTQKRAVTIPLNKIPGYKTEEVLYIGLESLTRGSEAIVSVTSSTSTKDASYRGSLRYLPYTLSSKDSYITDGQPNKNYGSEASLVVKRDAKNYNRVVFMGFPLKQQSPVKKATFTFKVSWTDSNPIRHYDVYGVLDTAWREETLTWNNAPFNKLTLTPIGSVAVSSSVKSQWYSVDITDYVNQHLGEDISLCIKSPNYGSKRGGNIISKESEPAFIQIQE